jgi:tetratricopeptide (TPR) repeat protein
MGDEKEATRYYRNAIFGSWDSDPARRRREVRLELCKFLLAHGETTDAKAELAALAADIPPDDVALHGQTGQLLSQAGAPAKALLEFESMLRTDPRQSEWLEEAGRTAYAAGDYAKAETYLARAVRENPSDGILSLHQTAREVLTSDPFQAGLTDQERAQRSEMHRPQHIGAYVCTAAFRSARPQQRSAGLQESHNPSHAKPGCRIAE